MKFPHETKELRINSLEQNLVQCPGCFCFHTDHQIVRKPDTSLLMIWFRNLRTFGWKCYIRQGEMVPIGYGIAWIQFAEATSVCRPIPINILARWFYGLYGWAVCSRRMMT